MSGTYQYLFWFGGVLGIWGVWGIWGDSKWSFGQEVMRNHQGYTQPYQAMLGIALACVLALEPRHGALSGVLA